MILWSGGGFPRGRCYVVVGDPGVGKSIFCMQFILAGLKRGEKAIYAAVDESPAQMIEEAGSLGWDLAAYVRKKELGVLDASPFFLSRAASGGSVGGVNVKQVSENLMTHINQMGAKRVVLDSIVPLVMSCEGNRSNWEYIRSLLHFLQQNLDVTSLFTSHGGLDRPVGGGVEEFLVAGIIYLSFRRVGNRLVRTILVRKMRSTAIDLVERRFDIMPGKGIAVMENGLPEYYPGQGRRADVDLDVVEDPPMTGSLFTPFGEK